MIRALPTLSERALVFAAKAHITQRRKYTNEPYIVHPIAVAQIVRSVTDDEMILAAAYLHDVIEDTPTPLIDIDLAFGGRVADYLNWLTDVSTRTMGNRATRQAIDREQISHAPAEVKLIKLADLIDNTLTIKQHDPEFWKVYRFEKLSLLEVLQEGDQTLWKRAVDQCAE